MTPPNNLDLNGNVQTHPLAELLVEIADARLDGSLRLTRDNHKVVVYLSGGEVIFAVSNSRFSRLFDLLLREGEIDKAFLDEHPDYANDFELAKVLIEKEMFTQEEIDGLFVFRIENILRDALDWKTGEWSFSPLLRLREDVRFKIGLQKLLLEYARNLSSEMASQQFKSVHEAFVVKPEPPSDVKPTPYETFVLSKFSDAPLKIEELKTASNLPDAVTLQTLYILWLGGFLLRRDWNAAFSETKIADITSARVMSKKEADLLRPAAKSEQIKNAPPAIKETAEAAAEKPLPPLVEEKISLEDYLERVEKGTNHYEILRVPVKSPAAEIKRVYFALAKRFHPDHFYKEADAQVHQRVQSAFSRIAQAYETLKHQDSREVYDFKIRKELAEREKRQAAEAAGAVISEAEAKRAEQTDQANDYFEQGQALLIGENYDKALPFLARAVHFAPAVARYHAFYGKALAAFEKQRHKAESELQTAIKLDADNPTFRIMLSEFFVRYGLLKRAEGELNRLLAAFPDNREARRLLDSLPKK